MKQHYDVLVIGAGPAGSIAAHKLIQEGKSVLVLEKMTFPRFVIGESLLPHIMDYLDKLDLLDVIGAQKYQVKDGVSFYHNDNKCQFLFNNQVSEDYWKYTWQVKRADFDNVLIQEAQKRGADLIYEATVTAVTNSSNLQTVEFEHPTMGKQTVTATFFIGCKWLWASFAALKRFRSSILSIASRGCFYTYP